jgi:hypothetical protein
MTASGADELLPVLARPTSLTVGAPVAAEPVPAPPLDGGSWVVELASTMTGDTFVVVLGSWLWGGVLVFCGVVSWGVVS